MARKQLGTPPSTGVHAATKAYTDTQISEITASKAVANGFASLDSGGKIPVAQLPSSIMEYQGTYNASTNSPSLANGTGNTGDVYRVSVAGSRDFGAGAISFEVGDYVIYNGSVWEKSDTTDSVATVNGYTGNVTLTKSDVGLSNVDNTSDASKPISTATQTALGGKEATANKDQANGHAGLDGTGRIATGPLRAGTAASWTYLRGDRQWAFVPQYQQSIDFVSDWWETGFGDSANSQLVVITPDYGLGGAPVLSLPAPSNIGLLYGRLTVENRSGIDITIDGNGRTIEGASSYFLRNGSRVEFFWGNSSGTSSEWKVSDRAGPVGQVADVSLVAFGKDTTRAAGTGDNPFGVKLQRAVRFTSVTYRAATADASGNLVVELRKNGVAISDSSTTIAAASQVAGGTTTGTWDFAEGDILTVQVTGVGTTPGKGLVADIKGLTT